MPEYEIRMHMPVEATWVIVETPLGTIDAYLVKHEDDPDSWFVLLRKDERPLPWRYYCEPKEWIRSVPSAGQRFTAEHTLDDEEIVRLAAQWYVSQYQTRANSG